ncbi:MAG: MFS transporter [Planctomycetota bacterium]
MSQLQIGIDAPSAADHPQLLHGLMGLLAVCSVLGIVDILIFHRIPEVIVRTSPFDRSAHTPGRRTIWIMLHWILIQPLRDRPFRRYVVADMLMTFAMTSSGMYALRNMRINLGLDAFEMGLLFFLVGPLSAVVSARFIGRPLDRFGPKKVMSVAAFCTVLGALPFMIAYPGMPAGALWSVMIFTFIVGSIAWGAFMMGRANVQLRFGDREGASRYVSAFNFYTGVGGVLGGLAGAGLTGALGFLRDDPIRLGPIVWNNWHAAFVLSMTVRIAGGFVLRGGRDQKAD